MTKRVIASKPSSDAPKPPTKKPAPKPKPVGYVTPDAPPEVAPRPATPDEVAAWQSWADAIRDSGAAAKSLERLSRDVDVADGDLGLSLERFAELHNGS